MSDMKEFIDLLVQAPPTQLDPSMIPLVKEWSNPPTALQILEVLDKCTHGGLASNFVMTILKGIYNGRLEAEGTSNEEVVKHARWRAAT